MLVDRAKRHGPNKLSNYLRTHETILQHLKDTGAIHEDSRLEETDARPNKFILDGILMLREGLLELTVAKVWWAMCLSYLTHSGVSTVAYADAFARVAESSDSCVRSQIDSNRAAYSGQLERSFRCN